MSWQLSVLSSIIRVISRDTGKTPELEKIQRGIVFDAPKKIAARLSTRRTEVGGVDSVWLNEANASKGVIVYLHGGSYVTGPMKVQWAWPAALVEGTGLAGLVVHYTMPDKGTYPRAIEDVVAVLAALREQGVGPIVIAGDSAGGGLTVASAYRLRDTKQPLPAALVLHSPWLDLTMANPESLAMEKRDVMLSSRGLREAAERYAGGTEVSHPELSPVLGDAGGLPPSITYVGDAEMFLPEDRDWVAKAVAAGSEAEIRIVPGGFHVSTSLVQFLPEARAAVAEQVQWIKKVLARTSA